MKKQLVSLILLLGCGSLLLPVSAAPVLLDRVIAVVNNDVVLESEVELLMRSVKSSAAESGQSLPDDQALRQQVLERLILDSLELQSARQVGLQISDTQLEQTIANIAAEQNQTVTALRAELAAQGIDYAEYRERLRKELLTGEITRLQVQRRINITQPEVNALVEMLKQREQSNVSYHIGHILIRPEAGQTMEQAKQRADQVVTQLRQGADFAKLALSESAGPKALEGGDWGWMNVNEMPTLFADVVTSPTPGSIIGPFRSSNGFHIIQVFNTKGQDKFTVSEVNSRHILLKPSVILSDDKARSLLDNYRQQLLSGSNSFAALAKQHSEDPGSAAKGGELGWSDPANYVPEFRDMLLKLQPGEISPPFHTTHGWHIVQLLDRREQDATDRALQQQAYRMLFNRRFTEESQAWQEQLREEAYIQYTDSDE